MKQPTIFEALRAKLGREPTNAECKEDVFRILREAAEERPSKKLARAARSPAGAARRAALKGGA
jgi:hypothetical protein